MHKMLCDQAFLHRAKAKKCQPSSRICSQTKRPSITMFPLLENNEGVAISIGQS